MEYRRFGSMIIARLDKGEEILEQLRAISLAEQVKLAQVSALGALDEFTAGVFDTGTKQFFPIFRFCLQQQWSQSFLLSLSRS